MSDNLIPIYTVDKPASDAGLPKLVRDNVPEIAMADGKWVKYRIALKEELPGLLKAKLAEEYKEVMDSWEGEDWPDAEEVGDLITVLGAIGIHYPNLGAIASNKNYIVGQFDKGIVLIDYGDRNG